MIGCDWDILLRAGDLVCTWVCIFVSLGREAKKVSGKRGKHGLLFVLDSKGLLNMFIHFSDGSRVLYEIIGGRRLFWMKWKSVGEREREMCD
jgi:hypothetical protein